MKLTGQLKLLPSILKFDVIPVGSWKKLTAINWAMPDRKWRLYSKGKRISAVIILKNP
jgi:hypothetical protein